MKYLRVGILCKQGGKRFTTVTATQSTQGANGRVLLEMLKSSFLLIMEKVNTEYIEFVKL